MIPRTVNIICAKRPVRSGCVPAVREPLYPDVSFAYAKTWRCSFCGARVRVVA